MRALYEGGRHDISSDVVRQLPPAARRLIGQAGDCEARLAALEVAAAMLLKRALSNGQASAPHSVKHRALADQLMPEEIWAKRCRAFLRDHNLASSLESYVRRFEGPLAARLEMLGDAVAAGEIGVDAGGL